MNKRFYSRILKAAAVIGTYLTGVLCVLMMLIVVYYTYRSDGIRYENLDNFVDTQAYEEVLDEQMHGLLSYLKTELESMEAPSLNAAGSQQEGLVMNRFLEGHSNIAYQLYDREGNLILWNSSLSEGDLKQLGNFIVLDFIKGTVDTDYIGNLDFTGYAAQGAGGAFLNKRLVIGIDTGFTAEDRIAAAKDNYFEIRYTTNSVMTAQIILFTVAVLLYVYLTVTIGQKEKKDEVSLSPVDYVPLEVVLLLGASGIWIVSSVLFALVEAMGVNRSWFFTGSILGILIHTIILVMYLSIVRRVKAKVEWKHTLLKQFADSVVKGSAFKNVVLQTILAFVIFMSANYVCLVYGTTIVKIILAGVDAAMCGQLVRWSLQRMEMYHSINMLNRGELEGYQLETSHFRKGSEKNLAEAINSIGDSLTKMLDENTRAERMKADLITNVSHDIKTPLTSIINYVDLLKGMNLDNELAKSYLKVLDEKSQRLKSLAEDLVEASRISSGIVKAEIENMDFRELLLQAGGEFDGLMGERGLNIITVAPQEPVFVKADRRHMWRVIENLYTNAAKYSLPHTRVYADLEIQEEHALFTLKNISEQPLNIKPEDLMERFIRADASRTTKGHGLGLSISKDLMDLQGGAFEIILDGDLFKAVISVPLGEQGGSKRQLP